MRRVPSKRLIPLALAAALGACGAVPGLGPAPPSRPDTTPIRTLAAPPATAVGRCHSAAEGTLLWVEIPCPYTFPPDRFAALQRALSARGLYDGSATGAPNTATAEAIRAYQAPWGLDSPTLSRDAAERLGLVIRRWAE